MTILSLLKFLKYYRFCYSATNCKILLYTSSLNNLGSARCIIHHKRDEILTTSNVVNTLRGMELAWYTLVWIVCTYFVDLKKSRSKDMNNSKELCFCWTKIFWLFTFKLLHLIWFDLGHWPLVTAFQSLYLNRMLSKNHHKECNLANFPWGNSNHATTFAFKNPQSYRLRS